MKHLRPILLAACIVAGPGFAGGLADPVIPIAPPPPPPPAPVPLDFYLGLQAGILSGGLAFDVVGADLEDIDIEGPLYGVHAGVQRAFGPVTLGIEVDYNTTNEDLEDSGTDIVVDLDTLAHLKLRAGTDVGPAFVYGTAGIGYAEMSVDTGGGPVDLADTTPVYGVGADVMVSQSFSLGAEYLVHDFEEMDGSAFDIDFYTLMLRASFHF